MTNDFPPQAAVGSADATMVIVESKPFLAFDNWMDEQLEILVARWIHTAAPNASRFERRRQQLADRSRLA